MKYHAFIELPRQFNEEAGVLVAVLNDLAGRLEKESGAPRIDFRIQDGDYGNKIGLSILVDTKEGEHEKSIEENGGS